MSSFTRAQRFMLDALHIDGGPSHMVAMDKEGWAEFARLVCMHRLEPMLHFKLMHWGEAIPSGIREQLQDGYRSQTIRNLALYRELVIVARILGDAGIPFIALKGAYLARFSYSQPGLRPMRDLDLLVKPEQAVQAFDTLTARGYRSSFGGSPDAYFVDRIHLPPLRSPGGIAIELHHHLTSLAISKSEFEEKVWASSVERTIGGKGVSFPCDEDMLLHLCIHASFDHQLDLGPLALLDIAMLVETERVDWDCFLQSVLAGGWCRCALPPLWLAQRHLGARVPESVIAVLEHGEPASAWAQSAEFLLFSDPSDHKVLDYGVQDILYAGKRRDRVLQTLRALFPPRSVIARHFPVRADSAWAYLFYPWRWYRLATDKVPPLLAVYRSGSESLRRLAHHRRVFAGWLAGGREGRRH